MDGAGQDSSLGTKATHVDKPLAEEASGILSGAEPGLKNDMVSFQVPCQVSLHRFWTPGA